MKPTVYRERAFYAGAKERGEIAEERWIARVIVRGEHIEGRGSDNWHALEDLADRLSDRLEQLESAHV